jgi:putative ABC transport system permease protein
MFDLDRWGEIWASLKKHKLRTLLTCVGVGWGIFMLVLMLGASKGFENGVKGQLDIAANTIFLWARKTSVSYQGLQPGRQIQFVNEDVPILRSKIPELDVICPRNRVHTNFVVKRKTKSASFNAFGDAPDYIKVKPMDIIKGRFINEMDMEERRKVVVVGEEVVKQLFEENEEPVGQYITANSIPFQIIGVFKTKGSGEDVMEDSKTMFFPHKTIQQAFNQGNKIFWFAFLPKPGVKAAFIERRVKEVLAQNHRVAPSDLEAFGSFNIEERFQQIQGVFTGMQGFSWFVSIGAILTGIIGVSNIMLIVVKERTKEIGIRKALGATPTSIVTLILQEALVITIFAGYMGLLIGVGMVEGINQLLKAFQLDGSFFANPEINFSVALTAMILLSVFGTLAGLFPALKAARVNPVVALQEE